MSNKALARIILSLSKGRADEVWGSCCRGGDVPP